MYFMFPKIMPWIFHFKLKKAKPSTLEQFQKKPSNFLIFFRNCSSLSSLIHIQVRQRRMKKADSMRTELRISENCLVLFDCWRQIYQIWFPKFNFVEKSRKISLSNGLTSLGYNPIIQTLCSLIVVPLSFRNLLKIGYILFLKKFLQFYPIINSQWIKNQIFVSSEPESFFCLY